jgi:hypothetical protein
MRDKQAKNRKGKRAGKGMRAGKGRKTERGRVGKGKGSGMRDKTRVQAKASRAESLDRVKK